jgi:GTP pyrophosphokinase
MKNLEKLLSDMVLAPYIFHAMALIGKPRKAGSNMFRHQLETFSILLDYKYIRPVLLKAACIHDLIEEYPDFNREVIRCTDADGPAVLQLVEEVSCRVILGKREPKNIFLTRIFMCGSQEAKVLKLADRISNLLSLGYVHDEAFVRNVLAETRACILPYAAQIDANMHRELSDLVADREDKLRMSKSGRNHPE